MIPAHVRIFVCTAPVDLPRSCDGLALAARARLGEDPRAGGLFCFREALALIGELFQIERGVATAPRAHREAVRQAQSRPVVDRFFAWCDDLVAHVRGETPLAAAIGYARNQRAALRRFLDDERLPLHNNRSELELRHQVMGAVMRSAPLCGRGGLSWWSDRRRRDRLSLTSGTRHRAWSYRPPLDTPKRPALRWRCCGTGMQPEGDGARPPSPAPRRPSCVAGDEGTRTWANSERLTALVESAGSTCGPQSAFATCLRARTRGSAAPRARRLPP